MTIEVGGPDGSTFQFPDGTPEATIIAAMSKHYGGQQAPSAQPEAPAPKAEPKGVMDTVKDVALHSVPYVGPVLGHMNRTGYSLNDAMRGFATGVPIAGGLVKKLDAATNATLAPVIEPFLKEGPESLRQETWGERYAKALELQNQMDAKAAEKSPLLDTGAKVAGGVASMIPAVAAAPAMFGAAPGAGVIANTAAGAASGGAIGGLDAITRGEDPAKGAIVNAAAGAAGPVLAKGIGKVADMVRGKPDLAPARTVNVAGEEVPLSRANVTRDFADSRTEQMLLDDANPTARGFDDARRASIKRAGDNLSQSLDPNGAPLGERVTPYDASAKILGDLEQNQLARRAAAADADMAALQTEATLRNDVGRGVRPAGDTIDAADYLAGRVRETAAAHKARTAALYKEAGEVEGAFRPQDFDNFSQRMKSSLGRGEDPLRIDSDRTPLAQRVLEDIDANVTGKQFENDLRFKSQTAKDGTVKEVTVKDIEAARKRITSALPDAKQKAINGDGSDQRALLRILEAFDARIEKLVADGRFSGNGADLLNKMRAARASHADYMAKFHPEQGSVVDDAGGKLFQKIVGRYQRGVEMTPGEISAAMYDLKSGQGGKAYKIGERIERVFGPNSPEMAAYKEGMISHLIDSPAGTTAKTAEDIAAALEGYLGGPTRLHASRFFTEAERNSIANLAAAQRGTIRQAPQNYIERTLEALSGGNGSMPQPSELAKLLTSYQGKDRVALALRLKQEMQPDSWNMLRRSIFDDLRMPKEGADHQAIFTSLDKFLKHNDMAKALFTPAEIANMRLLAETHKRMIPVQGSVNNSKTASHAKAGLEKTLNKVSDTLLSMLGLGVGGLPGMAAGFAAGKVLKGAAARSAERRAVDAFYGPQASVRTKVDPSGLAIAAQGAIPVLAGRR